MEHPTRHRVARLAAVAGLVLGVLAPATAAAAAGLPGDYPNPGPPPSVVPNDPGVPPTRVLGETVTRQADGSLAFTGGDIAGLAAIGLGATATGGLLVARSRRRRARLA